MLRFARELSIAAVVMFGANSAAAEVATPSIVQCVMTSAGGCGDEGICIANSIAPSRPITFNFVKMQYQSAFGRGQITNIWQKKDGSYAVFVSAPPIGGELSFAKDWSRMGMDSAGYGCKILKF